MDSISKKADFFEGDLIQVRSGEYAGQLGRIESIKLSARCTHFVYAVDLSGTSVNLRSNEMVFLSHKE